MTNRFVAPRRVDSFEDARKTFQLVQEQLDTDRLNARPDLVTKNTTLVSGEFVRISPRQGATLVAKLPKASADNFGQSITISLERPRGTLKIAAQKPDKVAGLFSASFTLAGVITLYSNGVDGWQLTNQIATNSPGGSVFANANNVTWGSSSTTSGPVTVTASAPIKVSAGGSSVLRTDYTWSNSNSISFGVSSNGVVTASYAYMPSAFFDLTISGALGVALLPAGIKMFDTIAYTLTADAVLGGYLMSDGTEPPDGFVLFVCLRDLSGGSAPGWSLTVLDNNGMPSGTPGIGFFRTPGQIQGTVPGPSYVMRSEEEGIIITYKRGASQRWSIVGGTAAQRITGPIEVIAGNGGIRTASFATNAVSNGLTVTGSSRIDWLGNAFSAGTAAATRGTGTWVFSNSNNVSFGRTGSTITASATFASPLMVSEIGANSVSGVTRLALGNALVMSTAASAGTISVDRPALSILALAASGVTASTGTVQWTNNALVTGAASLESVQNVVFALTGQTMGATAVFAVQDGTNSTATVGEDRVSKVFFANGTNITWGGGTATDTNGRFRLVSASVANPALAVYANFKGFGGGAENVSMANSFGASNLFLAPFQGGEPFPGPMTANTFEMLFRGHSHTSTQSTQAYGITVRGGVYTLVNSTQLGLVNSFSMGTNVAAENSSTRNDNAHGLRWLSVGTANWSSSPAFSQGVQYWFGMHVSTSGVDNLSRWLANGIRVVDNFKGQFGVANSAIIVSAIGPFWGIVSSNAPPTNISTGMLLSNGQAASSWFGCVHGFQMRQGVENA